MEYVDSVPGDCYRADAVNLLLSVLDGNEWMSQVIVARQPDGCLVPILGSVTAMLALLVQSLHPDDREHTLGHYRESCGHLEGPIGAIPEPAAARARSARAAPGVRVPA